VLVVIDAVVSAANPLIYREIINKGILGKDAGLDRVRWPCSSPGWPSPTPASPGRALHQRQGR
jgi:hypothetical protein